MNYPEEMHKFTRRQSLTASFFVPIVSSLSFCFFFSTGSVLSRQSFSADKSRILHAATFLVVKLTRSSLVLTTLHISYFKMLTSPKLAELNFFLEAHMAPDSGYFISHSVISCYELYSSHSFGRLFLVVQPLLQAL